MAPKEKQALDDKPPALREIIRELADEQKQLNLEVLRLANAVYGDEEAGHIGLVKDNKPHKEYITQDKLFKSKMAGIYAALSFVGAGLVIVIKETYHKIWP